jgi:hypothetical protein
LASLIDFNCNLAGQSDLQITVKAQGLDNHALREKLTLKGQFVLRDGQTSPFNLSQRFEDQIGLKAFDRGRVEDLVSTFVYGDRTFRFLTLGFSSGGIDYTIDGTIAENNRLNLNVSRDLTRSDVQILRSRSDFARLARGKSPKTAVFQISGTAETPTISVGAVHN